MLSFAKSMFLEGLGLVRSLGLAALQAMPVMGKEKAQNAMIANLQQEFEKVQSRTLP